METDFVKVGTNQEDMRGGVDGKDSVHQQHSVHCCHDTGCPNMCREEHKVPAETEHEGKNEHTSPDEVVPQEKGEHSGAYPGFVRKFR